MDLLNQLEQEFGVVTAATEAITLFGHKWTLRKLDYSDIDKANQFTFKSQDDGAGGIDGIEPLVLGFRSSLGFVAVSLAAIDDQPVWQVFKTAKAEEVVPFDPMFPPAKIRHRTADRVLAFMLAMKSNMDLVMQLYDLYTSKLDDRRREPEETAEAKAATGAAEGTATSPLTESGSAPPASAG
jgi:hypothetical protein